MASSPVARQSTPTISTACLLAMMEVPSIVAQAPSEVSQPFCALPPKPYALPTLEEFAAVTDCTPAVLPHIPISPLSQALDRHGMNARAKRADACGTRKFWKCEQGHIECDPRSCNLRCCGLCTKRIIQDGIDRFWKNVQYMRNLKRFWTGTFETDPQPTCPTREEYMAFHDSLAHWAKEHGDPTSGTGASTYASIECRYWIDNLGQPQRQFVLVARAFCWTVEGPGVLDLPYPGQGSIFCHDASELNAEITKFYSFSPERNAEVAAQIELAQTRLKTVRHFGQILKKEVLAEEDRLQQAAQSLTPEELVTMESAIVTNSDSPPKSLHRCCKKCHGPMTHYTEWLPYGTTEANLADVQWYKANVPEPPPAPPPPQ